MSIKRALARNQKKKADIKDKRNTKEAMNNMLETVVLNNLAVCTDNKQKYKAADIVRKNGERIWNYCQTYYLPMFAWVMYEHYGFRTKRIIDLHNAYMHIWRLIEESKNGPHVFLTLEWVYEGLEIEARHKYIKQEKPKANNFATLEEYVEYFSKCASFDIVADFEAVWLWVLHSEFGFGNKRLQQARDYLAQYEYMDYEDFQNRLALIEKCRPWIHDKQAEDIKFEEVRKQLRALGITEPGEMVLTLEY